MRRMLPAGALALLLAGLLSGRAGGAAEAVVTIDNFSFTPQRLVVTPGTRVTWINHDDIPHTVFGRAAHSPPLDTDESFSFVFDTPGTYGFFCSLHPHMQNEIEVR